MRSPVLLSVVATLGASVVLLACGTGPEPVATTSPTSSAVPSPSVMPTPSSSALPGEPFDGPPAGSRLAVVGVAYDDVLNVRSVPGVDDAIIAELAPTDDDVVLSGRARLLPSSIWFELERDGGGWVNASYLAFLGGTDDITSQVVSQLGERPTAETMLDLATIVAGARASNDPPSQVVTVVAPTVGDLGEVTVDVVGLGDDAVRGERLVVFATPDEGGESFTLRTVERTLLCGRGASDGSCP